MLFRCVTALFLTCFVSQIATAQQVLQIHNTMKEGVHLWIKSETRPESDWQRWFIRKNKTQSIKLLSPDRFHVVVEDQQCRRFSAGLVPLRAMIAENSKGVFKLGGEFETAVAQSLEWSAEERRWRIIQRAVPVRTAVTYEFSVRGKVFGTIIAPQSE